MTHEALEHDQPEGCVHPVRLDLVMTRKVIPIGMDTSLSRALELCGEHSIRHLPVVDASGRLEGLVTDRDLKLHLSPRVGTLSEKVSDLDTLRRPVHLIMTRNVVTATPDTPLRDAASLMLAHRVGCLPVVDREHRVCGIITTSDILRIVAGLG